MPYHLLAHPGYVAGECHIIYMRPALHRCPTRRFVYAINCDRIVTANRGPDMSGIPISHGDPLQPRDETHCVRPILVKHPLACSCPHPRRVERGYKSKKRRCASESNRYRIRTIRLILSSRPVRPQVSQATGSLDLFSAVALCNVGPERRLDQD
jgi:hypothetical protein